jgi:hypothetical protein
MPAQSARVLGLLSLEDPFSQFRPYDGKTRKFYRPKRRRTQFEYPIEQSATRPSLEPSAQPAARIIPDDEVDELPPVTERDRSLIPVGQASYRQSRYGNTGSKRQWKSPVVAFAEPGRECDAFKVFPIAYQDCVPDACQFCQSLPELHRASIVSYLFIR